MILKKKVIKNYIEVVPATHRLKIGEKLHLFKTHSNVHEYLVTFGHHRFTGTCILGRKRWLGVAFLTTEEAAAGCCPAPGWPQAPWVPDISSGEGNRVGRPHGRVDRRHPFPSQPAAGRPVGRRAGVQRAGSCDHKPGIFLATGFGKGQPDCLLKTAKRRHLFSSEEFLPRATGLFPDSPNTGAGRGFLRSANGTFSCVGRRGRSPKSGRCK